MILKIVDIYIAISIICLIFFMIIVFYDEIKYWLPNREKKSKKKARNRKQMHKVILEYTNISSEYANVIDVLKKYHIKIRKTKHESLYAYTTILIDEKDLWDLMYNLNQHSKNGIRPIKIKKESSIEKLARLLLEGEC